MNFLTTILYKLDDARWPFVLIISDHYDFHFWARCAAASTLARHMHHMRRIHEWFELIFF